MNSLKEKIKTMPVVRIEAGEYVIIETTINDVVVNKIAVCITGLNFHLQDGINQNKVKLTNIILGKEYTDLNIDII